MTNRFYVLLILVITISCSENNFDHFDSIELSANLSHSCKRENQDKILEIMESFINEESSIKEYQYILEATYRDELVFIFGDCCPFCNSLPPSVYNCSGDFLGRIDFYGSSEEGLNVPSNEIKNKSVFWPESSTCNF